jgi:hypothetical protein
LGGGGGGGGGGGRGVLTNVPKRTAFYFTQSTDRLFQMSKYYFEISMLRHTVLSIT